MVPTRRRPRCLRCPEEAFEFLGYCIGWNHHPKTGTRYIGTRPSKGSIQRICRRISEQTDCRFGLMDAEEMVRRLNRMISGWANYFTLGQVNPACHAIDQHTTRRPRQWFCRKHKRRSGNHVHFSDTRLRETYGLHSLAPRTKNFPWAKACVQLKAGCGKTARPV
ncbi:MAG: hypothetical protein F4120_06210 [Rhodothermaceae bacterium]|nr:hypothetical protein [Rhodothermaceae bacterium]MYI17202.1 hypothetical protein [Rhodothermaceae bacterium]